MYFKASPRASLSFVRVDSCDEWLDGVEGE
jgi:hypothetical protein